MSNILHTIVEAKRVEIDALHQLHDVAKLREAAQSAHKSPSRPAFYTRIAAYKAEKKPFFITEFKRKSPSEGWIAQGASVAEQVERYAKAGAAAISVLTDTPFFGGYYDDLRTAASALDTLYGAKNAQRPLLLQKDFVIDDIQIFLAKKYGADLVLLIAAILEPDRLEAFRQTAESIGMGVLVEVHDADELSRIDHLPFPVLGVNNRDLKTFRTALNRVNVFRARGTTDRYLISESSILDHRHFQMVRLADGFLIGTGLMRQKWPEGSTFSEYFMANGQKLFKACGLRRTEDMTALLHIGQPQPDYIGINFSPQSKRRIAPAVLSPMLAHPGFWYKAVAVFYKNSDEDVLETLRTFPFKTVQFYAGDHTLDFLRSLKQRILLAVRVTGDWREQVEKHAADVDCFILDGTVPGSGQQIETDIPTDFPYPFLLAGGIHIGNLHLAAGHSACIGVDIASGIETDGQVDIDKVEALASTIFTGIQP
jgi:indole-3-glycerol phosphate synthase / phosphoribosylanthranilate isomerase